MRLSPPEIEAQRRGQLPGALALCVALGFLGLLGLLLLEALRCLHALLAAVLLQGGGDDVVQRVEVHGTQGAPAHRRRPGAGQLRGVKQPAL